MRRRRNLRLEHPTDIASQLAVFSWDADPAAADALNPHAVRFYAQPHMAAAIAATAAIAGGACLFVCARTAPASLAHALRTLAAHIDAGIVA